MTNLTLTDPKRKPLLPQGNVSPETREYLKAVELTLLDGDAYESMEQPEEARRLRQRLAREIHIILGGAW